MKKRLLFLLALILVFPCSGLSAARISGFTYEPNDHAVSLSFAADGQEYVQVGYKSSMESGTVLFKEENGAFKGDVSLPLTYAGNNVTINILSLSGSKLDSFKARTKYPEAKPAAKPNADGPLYGLTVCIDPGHQLNSPGGIEPVGPGLKGTKAVVFGMAEGISTHRREAAVVLEIGLKLRDMLLEQGAQVVMTRDTMEKAVTNLERAQTANDANADICLRLHANANKSKTNRGIVVYTPLHSDYARAVAEPETYRLWGETLLDRMAKSTGAKPVGVGQTDTYVGSNWCKMPVFLIEMGYMTTPQDDLLLSLPEYQQKLCQGMADGITAISRMRGLID
jgi:N-acetylmuramoyl-L-alanine amidase